MSILGTVPVRASEQYVQYFGLYEYCKLVELCRTLKSRFLLDTDLFVRLTQAWRSIRDGSRMYPQKATLGRKVGKVLPKLLLGGRLL